MKVTYINKPKANDFKNERYTYQKEYDVLADYRNRHSRQIVADNGLVIVNDAGENDMVFLDNFKISDTTKGNTFIF